MRHHSFPRTVLARPIASYTSQSVFDSVAFFIYIFFGQCHSGAVLYKWSRVRISICAICLVPYPFSLGLLSRPIRTVSSSRSIETVFLHQASVSLESFTYVSSHACSLRDRFRSSRLWPTRSVIHYNSLVRFEDAQRYSRPVWDLWHVALRFHCTARFVSISQICPFPSGPIGRLSRHAFAWCLASFRCSPQPSLFGFTLLICDW